MRQLTNQMRPRLPGWMWGVIGLGGLLSCYFALRSGFCADDFVLLWESRAPFWDLLKDYVSSPDVFSAAYYRPLQRVVHLVEFKVFGSTAPLYHAVSILIHLLNAVIAHRLFLRMRASATIATAAAVVFAIHPAHTEPVTFISALSGVVGTTFVLLALLLYLRFTESGRKRDSVGVLVCVALALLSKEDTISVPIALGIVWFFYSRTRRHIWPVVATIPLVAVWLAWRWGIGGSLDPGSSGFSANPLTIARNLPFHMIRVLVSVRSLFRLTDFENYYTLRDTLLPTPHGAVYITAVVVVGLAAAVWVWRQWPRWPGYVKCGLGIGVSGLLLYLPLRESATRFLYFPIVGFSVALVGIVLLREVPWRRVVLLTWMTVLAASTVEQTSTWYQAGQRVDVVLGEAVKVREQHPPDIGTVYLDYPRRLYAALVFPIGLDDAVRWRTDVDWPFLYTTRDLPLDPATVPDSLVWYRWTDDRFVPVEPRNP